MQTLWRRLLACLLSAWLASAATAQDSFPGKPVRLIVPYAAGNVTDVVGRELARALSQRWGQSVVVVNMPGAGGAIGAAAGARAAPDGYSLTMVAMSALAVTPRLTRGGVPYDPVRDFTPLGMVAVPYAFLAVNSALPVRNVQELVAYARSRRSDPLFYLNPGIGTLSHLNMELLSRALDFPTQGVVYKGSGDGMTDLLAGRIHVTIDPLSVTLPHLQTGALRALAYTGPTRHPAFPNVPTVAEIAPNSGVSPVWLGLVGPRGMAPTLVDRIARDLQAVLTAPEFAQRMPAGLLVTTMTPDELGAQIQRNHEQFGRLLTELNMRPE